MEPLESQLTASDVELSSGELDKALEIAPPGWPSTRPAAG